MQVLIAEDSTSGRLVLRRAVERLGHQCRVAEDGDQAWELFQSHGADVIISDWMMPGLQGPELCARVRAVSPEPYVYFAFLTILNDKQHSLDGISAGADHYLGKPLDLLDLQACLIAAERVTAVHRRLVEKTSALESTNRDLVAKGIELEILNQALYDSARTDALTEIGNRLRLQEDLRTLRGRSSRYGHQYALALLDLDRFKAYNDALGHLAGDSVLRNVARALVTTVRQGDAVYRYGGEEIVVVMPEQDLTMAAMGAERLREAVEALAIPHPGNPPTLVVTCSVGVARVDPLLDTDEFDPLSRADAALYLAKATGRNRVATSTDVRLAASEASTTP